MGLDLLRAAATEGIGTYVRSVNYTSAPKTFRKLSAAFSLLGAKESMKNLRRLPCERENTLQIDDWRSCNAQVCVCVGGGGGRCNMGEQKNVSDG